MAPIILLEDINVEQQLRRQQVLADQESATGVRSQEKVTSLDKEDKPPVSRIDWLQGNPKLCHSIAKLISESLIFQLEVGRLVAASATVFCLVELPPFLPMLVHNIKPSTLMNCFAGPAPHVHLNVLLLCTLITGFKLPILSQTITKDFLDKFFKLQGTILKGLVGGEAASLDGPFDMLTRYLTNPMQDLPCSHIFRSLSAFLVGQCCKPPLAAPPSLGLEVGAQAGPDPGSNFVEGKEDFAPVIEAFSPPESLLELFAKGVLDEDDMLKAAQEGGKGPLFNTTLCHILYGLAVMVPHHPKAAAHSPAVRGAAFSQMIKIQGILMRGIQAPWLFDPADGSLQKPFLYVRSMACVRSALQCVVGSWLAAGFGSRFAISEEGGKDFIQYCTKHIMQSFNNKTALTKVLGSPWERVMMTQGPTPMIVELFLTVCGSDANLKEIAELGGQQALHNLSRYADKNEVRQQATILLTKLAVLQTPGGLQNTQKKGSMPRGGE